MTAPQQHGRVPVRYFATTAQKAAIRGLMRRAELPCGPNDRMGLLHRKPLGLPFVDVDALLVDVWLNQLSPDEASQAMRKLREWLE